MTLAKENKNSNYANRSKRKTLVKKSKLPGFFSFSNKKFVASLVIFVTFAGLGSYGIYQSSSSAASKDLKTIEGCRFSGIPPLRQGSSGSCVRAMQVVLNRAHLAMPEVRPYWSTLQEDGIFGSRTATAVTGYQRYINSRFDPDIDVDGVVGGQTWYHLDVNTCRDLRYRDLALVECR